MAYVSMVAGQNLADTPMKVIQNWPTVLLYTVSNVISDMLIGEPTVSFQEESGFWDPSILRRTVVQCILQGGQDVVNSAIWGSGGYTPPRTPADQMSAQPEISAYF